MGLEERQPLQEVSSDTLLPLVSLFRGGDISRFSHNWEKFTSDAHLLSIIKYGVFLRFTTPPPLVTPHRLGYSETESKQIHLEVQKLLKKGIIVPSERESHDFYSQVFLRDKKDGTYRFILNLKTLNKHVEKCHFKMESIKQIVAMVQKDCWMASIDLKDAYYTLPIHPDSRKYLKFVWDQVYEYPCMPNGYRDAPRIFTKLLKPVFGTLRERGHQSVVYLDDAYLQGLSFRECKVNVLLTIRVLQALGFTIHPHKTVINPVQEIITLGFVINSRLMTITLTEEKRSKLKNLCLLLLSHTSYTIRRAARVIGNLVAASEAVPLAPLYYRRLEIEKTKALRIARGDYDAYMAFSPKACLHLQWWINNLDTVFKSLNPCPVTVVIYSDASKIGWGATMGEEYTWGQWLQTEWDDGDINIMEITAAKFALLSFCKRFQNNCPPQHHFTVHVKLMIDNTTAVAYINHMGGSHSIRCNKVATDMWSWAAPRGIWLTAAHIPGVHNTLADYYSRKQKDSKEWALSTHIFHSLVTLFGTPDIDLFASRTNHKIQQYVSWYPDPDSAGVDAFTMEWSFDLPYCFPPFSLMGRLLKKIREEKVTAIVVAPLWATQSWYPTFVGMLVDYPAVCRASSDNLYLPHKPSLVHPLGTKLHLMIGKVSGDASQIKTFQRALSLSSWHRGGELPTPDMMLSLRNGKTFVWNGTSIPYTPL